MTSETKVATEWRAGFGSLWVVMLACFALALFPASRALEFGWLGAALVYTSRRYGLTNLHHPVVATFLLGVVVYALGFPSLSLIPWYQVSERAHTLSWFCLTLFLIGSHLIGAPSAAFPVKWERGMSKPLVFGGAAFAIFVVVGLLYFALQGAPLLQADAENARVTAGQGSGGLGTLMMASFTVGIPSLVCGAYVAGRRRAKGLARSLGILLAIAIFLALMALTGTRIFVLRGLVEAFIAISIVTRGKVSKSAVVIVSVLSIYFLSVLTSIRYGAEESAYVRVAQRLAAGPYMTEVLMRYTDARGGFGMQPFTQSFAIYSLSGSHPLFGEVLKAALGMQFAGGGVSVPLPAEGYMVGGYLVAAIFAVAAGILTGMVSRWMARRRDIIALIVGIAFGALWSDVFANGFSTTLAAFVIPTLAFSLVLATPRLLRERREMRVPAAELDS